MLQRPLTQLEKVVEAAEAILLTYDKASADPKTTIPSYMHAALLNLKLAMEKK